MAPRPTTGLAVLVVDDDCHCIEASSVACRLLSRSRDEVVGHDFEELIAPPMRNRFNHVWTAFRDGGGHAGPFELERAGATAEIEIAVTENLMPDRHLLVISPSGEMPHGGAPSHTGGIDELPRPSAVRQPSAREREVLKLLAAGATDPQIAEMLELSPATVQTHVRNAKAKLGARTRAQAVAIAIGRNLIALD